MSTENNLNSELYVNGLVWEESYWEWQLETYPVSLDKLCKYFFEWIVLFDVDINFYTYDALRTKTENEAFNHTVEYSPVDLTDILDLFNKDTKQDDTFLHWKWILTSLAVPYRDMEATHLEVPLPLSAFFNLLRNHYHKPQIKIEDIPF